MKDKNIYFYGAAALALIVPVPGRFAFGVLLALLFVIQIVTGVLMCHLVAILKLDDLKNVLVSVALIAVTVFYKQLLILFCPIAAFTLGFLIFLPALSAVIIEFSFKENDMPLIEDLREKVMRILVFISCMLGIYLFRDIVGFGTLTLPAFNKIATIHLFSAKPDTTYASSFLATISGAFVIVAVILAGYIIVKKQFDRIERQGDMQ
ncbi:MAG: hypothetical protein IJS09_07790 [Treponema sp.]|nr:hypothetical protein [Treponema sp.]